MDVLSRAKEIRAERDLGDSVDDVVAAKRRARDERCGVILGALDSLSGHFVNIGGRYMDVEVQRNYGEVVVCFVPREPFTAVDGKTRWKKGKNAANKWCFTPEGERGVEVAWENGLQHYVELEAALEDAAKRIGAILCAPPWESPEKE